MKSLLLSIIIPVYNVKSYLTKAIDSILGCQSLNFELILINDGSTDHSGEICEEYARKDERIRVIHKKNEGVSIARNVGINAALGKFIVFFDADDYVDMDIFSKSFDSFKKSEAEIQMSGLYIDYYKDSVLEKRDILTIGINKTVSINEMSMLFELMYEKGNVFTACNKIFKTSIIRMHNIKFDKKCITYEDFVFVLDYLMNCSHVDISDNAYYFYRVVNKDNGMEKREQKYIVENCLIICSKLNGFLDKLYYNNEKNRLNWNLNFYHLSLYRVILSKATFRNQLNMITDLGKEFGKLDFKKLSHIKNVVGKQRKTLFILLKYECKTLIWLAYNLYRRILFAKRSFS